MSGDCTLDRVSRRSAPARRAKLSRIPVALTPYAKSWGTPNEDAANDLAIHHFVAFPRRAFFGAVSGRGGRESRLPAPSCNPAARGLAPSFRRLFFACSDLISACSAPVPDLLSSLFRARSSAQPSGCSRGKALTSHCFLEQSADRGAKKRPASRRPDRRRIEAQPSPAAGFTASPPAPSACSRPPRTRCAAN